MDNIIRVDFSRTHWKRCVDPSCEDCFIETVVDTYMSFHPYIEREEIRQIIMQGLAFQTSLEKIRVEEG